jgi:hypothetical protein
VWLFPPFCIIVCQRLPAARALLRCLRLPALPHCLPPPSAAADARTAADVRAESAAAAALREAEAAILAAEQAQQAALQELQKGRQQQQPAQKKGWF